MVARSAACLAFTVLCLFVPTASGQSGANKATLTPDREAAQEAYAYLNNFRADPSRYGREIGLILSNVRAQDALQWNDALARAAESKALDMARRGYFRHKDPEGFGMNVRMHRAGYRLPKSWRRPRSLNYFESIGAGAESGQELIDMLIIDEGVPSLGHRAHLLGIDKGSGFNSRCADIGIGFVFMDEDAEYASYACILIAFQPDKDNDH